MASTLTFFMALDDELSFLRFLEPRRLLVYPEVVEPSYEPFEASAANAGRLPEESCYFALGACGEVSLSKVQRGKNAGMLVLDEVLSPVLHYSRSLMIEGELRSGRIWTELEVAGDRQHRAAKPDALRHLFDECRTFFKKRFHTSRPTGFFVGPSAARRANDGLLLREAGRKGGLVQTYR